MIFLILTEDYLRIISLKNLANLTFRKIAFFFKHRDVYKDWRKCTLFASVTAIVRNKVACTSLKINYSGGLVFKRQANALVLRSWSG